MKIVVKDCTVSLTKQTLLELVKIVERAEIELTEKGITEFSDEPMPDCDMSTIMFEREKIKRGYIRVKSPWNVGMDFLVDLNNCESAGFSWHYPEDNKNDLAIKRN